MKKIRFFVRPDVPFHVEPPVPGSNLIPEWFRKGESFLSRETNKVASKDDPFKTAGMKGCMPFFDSLTSGYLLVTWADVEITKNDDDGSLLEFRYLEPDIYGKPTETNNDYRMIIERVGDLGHTIPRPVGHSYNHMAWSSQWGMSLPKGWSLLITHPMNRFDLPFTTMSAIMESDRFSPNGNIPFFIQKGWTGVIPKGTPFAQIVPIKRSSWISTFSKMTTRDKFLAISAREVDYGFYRSKIWVPKKYKADYDKKK
jgi:hypothetical protein